MKPFSAIIAWRNRPELAHTLEANARFFERHCDEIVVVNCGGDPDEVVRMASGRAIAGLRQVHLPDTPFNKCLANNIGILSSSRPFLFFLDTDIVLESDVFAEARRLLERGNCFVKVRTVFESQPRVREEMHKVEEIITTTKIVFKNGRAAYTRTFRGGDGSRCGAGLLLVQRPHLMAIGGFNSAMTGWGFDDIDLHFRLQFVLRLKLRATGRVLHLTHGDERRDVASGSLEQDHRRNMMLCADNYNRDDFMGTCERDGELWRDRLHQIPLGGNLARSVA